MEARLPPHNLDAERSVLGALLLEENAVVEVAEFLLPEDFYYDKHARIYEAMLNLYEKREPIDLVTVPQELQAFKALDVVGGVSYLTELLSEIPTASNVAFHARIVKDRSVRRRLIEMSSRISLKSYDDSLETSNLLDEAERSIFAVSQQNIRQDFVPIRQTLTDSFDRLDQLYRSKGGLRGVPTGLRLLDQKLSGLQDSNLIILAARPSVGKTSLALNIAQHLGVEKKIPVGIFSLEMSREQLVDRMLSSQADVDAWRITTGNLEDADFARLNDAMGELAEAPLFVDDTPGISVMEMRTKARRLQMEYGLKLIIVDYLQLCRGRGLENRVQEVSEMSQGLKNLARELKVPVLCLSQLSRAVESRGSPKPVLSDLRESGSIEQDADAVVFLYRTEEDDRSQIMLSIAKHRNGPIGEIPMYFRAERTKFYEVDTKESPVESE